MAALNSYGVSDVNLSLEAKKYLPFPLSSIHLSFSVFVTLMSPNVTLMDWYRISKVTYQHINNFKMKSSNAREFVM